MTEQKPDNTEITKDETQPKIFSTVEAAAYLGRGIPSMKKLVFSDPPVIKPDGKIGPSVYFYQATLDKFQAQQNEGLVVEDAAKYLGITVDLFKYYKYNHPDPEKRLHATGKRGWNNTYTTEYLDEMKKKLNIRKRRKTKE